MTNIRSNAKGMKSSTHEADQRPCDLGTEGGEQLDHNQPSASVEHHNDPPDSSSTGEIMSADITTALVPALSPSINTPTDQGIPTPPAETMDEVINAEPNLFFDDDQLFRCSYELDKLNWPLLSNEELNDSRGPDPFYSKNAMATLVKVIIMNKDPEKTSDECCLLLSSIDFDSLVLETILEDESPVDILSNSDWSHRNPEVSKLICELSDSFSVENQHSKQFPRTPTSIEAPLPFPILVSETPSIGKEESHRNIWAITRFWVDNPDVHIHV